MLLTEGARDRALEQFIPLLQRRGVQMSISQLKQYLLDKFVNEGNIHNLSLDSNFYLVGVAKYYFNGDLTVNKQLAILYPRVRDRFNAEICQRLDALILILRNAYIDSVGTQWEQPEDFGTLSIQQLFRKYNTKINKALGLVTKSEVEKPEIKITKEGKASKNYTYDIIYSYSEAQKYNQYTTPGAWCITYGQQHYNSYVRRLGIHYVVFRQNGFESVPRVKGKWINDPSVSDPKPQDAYGNSLICLLQSNSSPEPVYITSRWNHGTNNYYEGRCEADHAYTKEEFLNIIGADESLLQKIYNEWRAGKESYKTTRSEESIAAASETREKKLTYMRLFKYLQMLINGGTNPLTFQYTNNQGEIEHYIRIKPIGWDVREWLERNNIDADSLAPQRQSLPPKAMYAVSIDNEFVTLMDRKVLMMDKVFEPGNCNNMWVENNNDLYMTIEVGNYDNKRYVIFDKRRHRLLDVGGVSEFKKISLRSYEKDIKKYCIVALAKKQKALIDLERMSPVSIRGNVWFEEIADFKHSAGYERNKITFQSIGKITRMTYDSASGEEYFYDTEKKTVINIYAGIPEGMYEVTSRVYGSDLGENIAVFSNMQLPRYTYRYTNHLNEDVDRFYMFKDLNKNEIITINGTSQFLSFSKSLNIVSYVPFDGNNDVENKRFLYYDERLGDFIRDENGVPLQTKKNMAYIREYGGNLLFLKFIVDNSEDIILFYANGTGKFYHDNINGYVFRYNYWMEKCVFYPGKHISGFAAELQQYKKPDGGLLKNDIMYELPPEEEMFRNADYIESRYNDPSPSTQFNESLGLIGRILREEINKLMFLNL